MSAAVALHATRCHALSAHLSNLWLMLIWAVKSELLVLLVLPAQTQTQGRVNRWKLSLSVFKHEDQAAECINTASVPPAVLPLLAWQRGTLLIREFTQSQASPSNCYPQWQTTPFSLSVGLQFTLPPPLWAPAAHSARCHAAFCGLSAKTLPLHQRLASRPSNPTHVYKCHVLQPTVCLCVLFLCTRGVHERMR